MSWTLVSLADVAAQPWRNGGGSTRELLAWPSPADWRVRMSVADVETAGPFSRFEGIERWFAVLEGAGVVLRVDGREHRLGRDDAPFRFDGAAAVDCTLVGGATRDFNLMARPGAARLLRVRGETTVHIDGPRLVGVYAQAGAAECTLAGETVRVPPRHLAWRLLEAATSGSVGGEDALWMEAKR